MAHNFVNNQSFQNLEVVLYRAQTKNQIDIYIEFWTSVLTELMFERVVRSREIPVPSFCKTSAHPKIPASKSPSSHHYFTLHSFRREQRNIHRIFSIVALQAPTFWASAARCLGLQVASHSLQRCGSEVMATPSLTIPVWYRAITAPPNFGCMVLARYQRRIFLIMDLVGARNFNLNAWYSQCSLSTLTLWVAAREVANVVDRRVSGRIFS
jgi:hypothetical protein